VKLGEAMRTQAWTIYGDLGRLVAGRDGNRPFARREQGR
jgi:hypothetical protein